MTCPLCAPLLGKGLREVSPGVFVDEPRCAFDEVGAFQAENNWNCQTLAAIRELPHHQITSEDQSLAVFSDRAGGFVVLGWYKSRGRVEIALFMKEYDSTPLTLTTAQAVLASRRPS